MDADRRKALEETTRWDPGAVEGRVFERWMEGGWFSPPATGSPDENYSIAIPPPNVTGALHMGHALNGSVQDALIRMNRMRGRNAMWILGTDHAGIGTQAVVEKELAAKGEPDRHEMGREAFEKRIWEWREQYGSTIVEQFKRLGASCDYERERFTLDEGYVEAVYRVFTDLYEKGSIYRDSYMVNWDPGLQSAISDLEIENREVTDTLYEIAYPLEGGGELVVATVRPETMLADTAVAVNPDDPRYKDAVGKQATLPLVGRELPVIADDHVDVEFGTGALKITPGHDPNDFEIGREHKLEEISVIGEDGRITDAAPEKYRGMTAAEARDAVVEDLRAEGALRGEEPYTHSVPFSHRSGERIEPLISLQWFCAMEGMAKPAIEVVRDGRVRFIPEAQGQVYLDWLERIRPWCVSRQLWWGHRLPVWYRGDETYVGTEPPEGDGWEQETDVLDTWFSSALWPFATLGWPDTDADTFKAFFPTDVLSTARDIIFLWVARMVMTSLEFTGEVPFRDVYIHSVIQAPDGRRMSKSLGTGIDPLDEIEVHGADALRFGLLAMSSTQDVRYSEARVKQGRDLANKMWNASRLVLLNAAEGVEAKPSRDEVEDRWIASRLQRAIAAFDERVAVYDFSKAVLDLYEFFWSELCDWYLEIVKQRLYDGDSGASATLLWALEEVLALAHPVMPFVTEEVYSYLPSTSADALAIHPFPEVDDSLIDEEAEAEIGSAIELTRALRRWRDLAGVPAGAELSARANGADPHELVGRLARVNFTGAEGEPMARVSGVELLAAEGIDADAVAARIDERRETLRSEVKRGEGKLSNEKFVANAPPEVVEEERGKLDAYKAELEELGGLSAEEILRAREPLGWRLGLERMHRLTSLLGMPQRRFASIHVVGTNGKTSVARMTVALLESHGFPAGAYLSPHLSDWRERIVIGGEPIAADSFEAALEQTEAAAQAADRAAGEDGPVTQFELLTAAAFVALAAAKVKVAVIEAGLGGRLDATNVIPSLATVLTSVGLDHTEYLGDTLAEIAGEKVAVLRDRSVLIHGALGPEAETVAEQAAATHFAETRVAGDPPAGIGEEMPPYQRRNLALALAAAALVTGELRSGAIAEALASLPVPGRAQVIPGEPPVVLDAAHNADGARALAEALPGLISPAARVVCCIAVLEGKDSAGICDAVAPLCAEAVCTEVPEEAIAAGGRPGGRSLAASGLQEEFERRDVPASAEPGLESAVSAARDRAAELGLPLLVTGSHFLIGAAAAILRP